jgi:hypothetical protein
MQKKKYIILTAVVVITLLTTSTSAIASVITNKNHNGSSFHPKNNPRGIRPGIGGAVAAISGTSLIITGQDGTTYTVDTTKAKITRGFGPNMQTLVLGDIKIGDKIGIMGTVSGTNVIAKTIIDGIGLIRDKETSDQENSHIAGTITSVSPYSFTIAVQPFHGKRDTSSPVVYTIDTASNTLVTSGGSSASLGDLTVGQTVIVRGTIDNTAKTVAASKVNIITTKIQLPHLTKSPRVNKNK